LENANAIAKAQAIFANFTIIESSIAISD
jgi:hypothetical protein